MTTMLLRSQTPCCGADVRLFVVDGVPVERYDRRCRTCGTDWQVTRTTIVVGTDDTVRRIDRLDWTDGDR